MKGFKKCCISNAVDGTDDYMLWIGCEEDGNVRDECEENEGIDCERWRLRHWLVQEIGSDMLCVLSV